MGFSVAGKVCLITGSAGGLGKEFARKLLELGGKVCLSDVNETAGQETLEQFKQDFNENDVTFFKLNVVDKHEWISALEHCEEVFKEPVEVLINNAGIAPNLNHDLNLDINIRGVMHGSTAFVKRYGKSKNGKGGRIVQISSMAGILNGFQWDKSGYEVSKWGVVAYTRQFSESGRKTNPWLADGVKSYCLCPWFVDTPLIQNTDFDEARMKRRSGFRVLKTEEISRVMTDAAFKEDENGAVYVIFPDIPALKFPNWNKELMVLVVGLAKFVALFNPSHKSLNTKTAVIVALVVLLLISFLLGFLVHFALY